MRLMSKKEFAEHIGKSPQAVSRMVRQGRVLVDQNGKIHPKKAKRELRASQRRPRAIAGGTLTDAIKKRTLMQTRKLELDLKQREGKLVPVAEVQDAVSQMCANIRNRLLQMPAKLTKRLFGTTDRVAFKTVLENEIRDTLTELGTGSEILAGVSGG
jgi:hypothetical protein